jgi:hypothetical protein
LRQIVAAQLRATEYLAGECVMHWVFIILIIIGGYYFAILFLSRLLLPHYGFQKSKMPRHISDQLQQEIDTLKKKYPSKDMFLRAAYDKIALRYRPTFSVLLHIPTLFMKSPEKLWNRKDRFIACHQLNFLFRVFLVKSGLFSDQDIEIRYSVTDYVMTHQYVHIYLDGRDDDALNKQDEIDVDPWGKRYGIPFGEYGRRWISPRRRF